jgi:hypothetical protein
MLVGFSPFNWETIKDILRGFGEGFEVSWWSYSIDFYSSYRSLEEDASQASFQEIVCWTSAK